MKDFTFFSSVFENRLTTFAHRYNQSPLKGIEKVMEMWGSAEIGEPPHSVGAINYSRGNSKNS